MTEAQWLKCKSATDLFAQVARTRRTGQRVYRLFAAGFWRWQQTRLKKASEREEMSARLDKLEEWAETGRPPKGVLPNRNPVLVFFHTRARAVAENAVGLAEEWGEKEVKVVLCRLLREVFGNPFRRVKRDPAWLTSDVVALARGIYDERAFDRMPILADALQDAGCTNEGLLNHCRDPDQLHVRGCWALDLVLGKS